MKLGLRSIGQAGWGQYPFSIVCTDIEPVNDIANEESTKKVVLVVGESILAPTSDLATDARFDRPNLYFSQQPEGNHKLALTRQPKSKM